MAAGALVQFLIGALAPFLAQDLGLSRTALGGLTSALFASAALLSAVSGRLVDRFGVQVMLVALFAATAGAIAGMALAGQVASFTAAVVLGGVGLAIMNPVTNQAIAVSVPPGRRGVVTGVKQSGVLVGSALTGLIVPAAAVAFGWRPTLLAIAGLIVAVGVAATAVTASAPPASAAGAEHTTPAAAPSLRKGFLVAGAFAMGSALSVFGAFFVLFAVEEVGLAVPIAGVAFAIGSLAGVAGRVLWGQAAERMASVALTLAVLSALAAVAQALIWAGVAAPLLLWVGVLAHGATAGAWNAVAMVGVIRAAPAGTVGLSSGQVQSAFFLAFILAPVAFGALVDAAGSYDLAWALTTAVFLLAATTSLAWWTADRRQDHRGATR